jgi:hypothetical protein
VDRIDLGTVGDDGVATPEPVLDIPHPYVHKGGDLVLTPAGDLLVSLASAPVKPASPEPETAGADGSVQRPDGVVLRIPRDRIEGALAPAQHEVPAAWLVARGFRNPWRIALASDESVLVWDVGESRTEELNHVPTGTGASVGSPPNYGWPYREGVDPFVEVDPPVGEELVGPAFSYPHGDGACAIVGGVAYGGAELAIPENSAVFGDYCGSALWALDMGGDGMAGVGESGEPKQRQKLVELPAAPTVIAADEAGEVLVGTAEGEVFRVVGADSSDGDQTETGQAEDGPATAPVTGETEPGPGAPQSPTFCAFIGSLRDLASLQSSTPTEFEQIAGELTATFEAATLQDALPVEPRADYGQLAPLFARLAELGANNDWDVGSADVQRLIKMVQAERGSFSTALRAQILLLDHGEACS